MEHPDGSAEAEPVAEDVLRERAQRHRQAFLDFVRTVVTGLEEEEGLEEGTLAGEITESSWEGGLDGLVRDMERAIDPVLTRQGYNASEMPHRLLRASENDTAAMPAESTPGQSTDPESTPTDSPAIPGASNDGNAAPNQPDAPTVDPATAAAGNDNNIRDPTGPEEPVAGTPASSADPGLGIFNFDRDAAYQDWHSPWKFRSEAKRWGRDYGKVIAETMSPNGMTPVPSTANILGLATMGGYRGYGKSRDYSWAIDTLDTADGPICCPVVDIHPGAFLGVVSGEVRYGPAAANLPKDERILGPCELVLHRTGSRFTHLTLGRQAESNVRVAWEAYPDQDYYAPPGTVGYERILSFRVLVFAAESCAAFSPLRL